MNDDLLKLLGTLSVFQVIVVVATFGLLSYIIKFIMFKFLLNRRVCHPGVVSIGSSFGIVKAFVLYILLVFAFSQLSVDFKIPVWTVVAAAPVLNVVQLYKAADEPGFPVIMVSFLSDAVIYAVAVIAVIVSPVAAFLPFLQK